MLEKIVMKQQLHKSGTRTAYLHNLQFVAKMDFGFHLRRQALRHFSHQKTNHEHGSKDHRDRATQLDLLNIIH